MEYLVVADSGNHRIVKRLASDLSYLSQIGSSGTGNDQFNLPRNVASDGVYVYVADTGNARLVKRLLSDLSYVSQAAVTSLYKVACDGEYLYATAGTYCRKYNLDLTYASVQSSSIAGLLLGVGIYGEYVYVTRDDGAASQGVYKLNRSDLTTAAFNVTARSADADKFHTPIGVCCDGTYVYVAETVNNRVKVLNASDLSYVTNITGAGADALDTPRGVATDGTYLWIMEWNADRLQKREVDGDYVSMIGSSGTGDDEFDQPHGVCFVEAYGYGQVQVDGAWKSIIDAQIQVGGVWKTATEFQIQVGNAWKDTA
jgi:DNA-binding beta-propeller fold protein YncE